MPQRILVIHGHPSREGLTADLARAYHEGALSEGAEVRLLDLADPAFNPHLTGGFKGHQPLEPGLVEAQEWVDWADHLVWVFPVWWGGWPAVMKGFIDRTFLPGFAFQYRAGKRGWDRLLNGKTAHLVVTSGAPVFWERWVRRDGAVRQLRRATLGFCGIRTTRVTRFGQVDHAAPETRRRWVDQLRSLGRAKA